MIKKYRIEFSRSAERQLKAVPRADQERIVRSILSLESNPFPSGVRKLSGYDDVFRIRVGTYRILYSVQGTHLLVIVLKIGHRKDVYRGL
ncbi:MAG TPA: type II toxin-antitoxin system RelE/ParE family toxin [Bdellovibrionota bacterium]|nr:type II toxin-antitoxin system RelE/ParE family toxin [Bdellovibrionota bacterium]